jgi:tetratricopeptide (TPR) repeat protein
MAASQPELASLLQAGITAIQRGERAAGRALLLRVVERDEHNEQAWLWLSQAVDDPADVQVALENVLAVNPGNAEARGRLQELGVPAAPADAWQSLLAATGVEPDDGIDDPLQCPACGQPTREADRRCPRCGQKLYLRVQRSQDSSFFKLGRLVLGIHAGAALIQLGLPLMQLNALQAGTQAGLRLLLEVPGAALALGNVLALPEATASLLAYVLGVRLLILALLLLGLFQRWSAAFYGALVALAADILLNVVLLVGGWLGVGQGLLNLGLALASLYLIGASYQEFMVTWERVLTRPDQQARSAATFHRLGHDYSRAGLWALAVAQWRKAVGLAPKEAAYYKHLGIGYARIQRYQRSFKALEEAARRAPQDHDLPEIMALVREQAARQRAAKR